MSNSSSLAASTLVVLEPMPSSELVFSVTLHDYKWLDGHEMDRIDRSTSISSSLDAKRDKPVRSRPIFCCRMDPV